MTDIIRHSLGLPLHYLYYLKDFEDYDGLDESGLQYLIDKYEDRLLSPTRAGVAWAAKNPDFDYASVAPYEGYPYTNDQIHFYLRRFHETLEERIAERGYTLPIRFDTAVTYLTPTERLAVRANVHDGLLVGMKGPVDTSESFRLFGSVGHGMYVMLANGMLLVTSHGPAGVLHHSSLAGGEPIACAGTIKVVEGRLTDIDRTSGHYQTTPAMLQQALNHLRQQGIDLAGVEVIGL